jgi:ABC-type Fe3+-hydroxamate transport system substrate-binding protein
VEQEMTIPLQDDRGRRLQLARPPQRIVSLVPSDTYTLMRLGAGARLVGRTRYCVEPQPDVAEVEAVGGAVDPDVDRIVALRPELVIANQEDNRRSDVEALERAGVPVLVSHPRTAQASLEHAARLALLFPDRRAHSAALLQAARRTIEGVRQRRGAPLRTFVPVWLEPLVSVGPDTFITDVLRLVGAANVFAEDAVLREGAPARYPRVTAAEVVGREPDLVLLPDEPQAFTDEQAEHLRKLAAGARSPDSVVVRRCAGPDLIWYGLRFAEGLERLCAEVDAARAALGRA